MAELAMFFDSVAGDRAYNSQNLADLFEGGVATQGIIRQGADPLKVIPRAPVQMGVRVNPGGAWVRGRYYELTANLDVAINAANAGLGRIDRLVIRQDLTTRTMAIVYVPGVAAAVPAAPALLNTAQVIDVPLAQVSIPAADVDIAANQITDERIYSAALGEALPFNRTDFANPADVVLTFGTAGASTFTQEASGKMSWGPSPGAKDASLARTAANVMTFGNRLAVDKGLDIGTTSADGYSGGQLRFTTATADVASGISTMAVGSPVMNFDHRGAGNLGGFRWGVGTNGATTVMFLSDASVLTLGGGTGTMALSTMNLAQAGGGVRDAVSGHRVLYFDAASIYLGGVDGTRPVFIRGGAIDVAEFTALGDTRWGQIPGTTHESYRQTGKAQASGRGFSVNADGAAFQGGVTTGVSVAVNRVAPAVSINQGSSAGDILQGWFGTFQMLQVRGDGYTRIRGEMRLGVDAFDDTVNSTRLWLYAPNLDANVYLTAEGHYTDISFKVRTKGNSYFQVFSGGGSQEMFRVGLGESRTIGNSHYFGQGAMGAAHSYLRIYADVAPSDVWLYAHGTGGASYVSMAYRATSHQFWDDSAQTVLHLTNRAGVAAFQTSAYLYFVDSGGTGHWSRVFAARNSAFDGWIGPNGHLLYTTF